MRPYAVWSVIIIVVSLSSGARFAIAAACLQMTAMSASHQFASLKPCVSAQSRQWTFQSVLICIHSTTAV